MITSSCLELFFSKKVLRFHLQKCECEVLRARVRELEKEKRGLQQQLEDTKKALKDARENRYGFFTTSPWFLASSESAFDDRKS